MAYILTNATVRTSDAAQPLADTIAVEGGRITFVGRRADCVAGPRFEVRDLGGRTVVPGFIDAHTHPSMVSRSRWHVRLPWTESVDEILDFIAAYAAAHPREETPFLYFEYYPSTAFGDRLPTKELLDRVVSDRPVLCQEFSEHQHWVNSKMLELMGVDASTQDPVPGLEEFVRDADGEPTGLLRELVHLHFLDEMYDKINWRPPAGLNPEDMASFFRFMTEQGVTSLFEALVDDEQVIASVAELDRHGELLLRYEGALRFRDRSDLPKTIARAKELDERYGSERVRVRTLKLFLDGTNETGNGAVLEPLDTGTFGEIAMGCTELSECLSASNAAEVDVHIHLVGDRAFRIACDAVEAAQRHTRNIDTPWRIQVTFAHCELVDPTDMGRPAKLGVFVNWTPHWSGGYFGDEARRHLGRERWNRMYDFTDIVASGAPVTFGSDVVTEYELHRGAPLFGMQVAATRLDPEYPLDAAQYGTSARPASAARFRVETLLRGYTIDAARQLRIDGRVGSIEVGKDANFSVLDADPVETDPRRLSDVHVQAVFFEGDLVAGSI